MTGEITHWLGLGWMLVASLGCTHASGGPAAADPGNPGSPARNEAETGGASAAVPACEARWPESAGDGLPHWIAINDQGDLRVIDIADPNSELLTLSSHEATGENVHDSYIEWSTDGRWLAFATFYAQGGMALYVVEMTSDAPGLPRLIAGSADAFLVIDEVHWSPRNHVVYVAGDRPPDQTPSGKLMVAAIEEGQPSSPVTLSESYFRNTLRWAPDGSKLSLRTGSGDRLLVRPDDPLQQALVGRGPARTEETANWSPDGRYLATFDDALRAYDTHADRPRVMVLSQAPAPERSIASLAWSDDARFLVAQGSQGGALMLFDMHATAPARAPTVELADRHGATRFHAFSPHEGFRSNDFGFAPDGQHIVFAASDVGWVMMDLATAEVDMQSIAPLNAGLLGFSGASELLWVDSAGIHSTSLDRRRDRVILGVDTFDAGTAFEYSNGRSAGIAPSGDRFALAGSGKGSELHIMMMDGCEALRATFEYPERWSGIVSSGGYGWEWLHDSSGVVQQTYLGAGDLAESRARLEFVRPLGSRMTVRTLMERSVEDQYNPFTWLEQP